MARKKKISSQLAANPDMLREVAAAATFLLGLLLLLGLFDLAGSVGTLLVQVFAVLFGSVRFLLPVVLIGLGVGLFLNRLEFTARRSIPVVILLCALPALLNPYGGTIGEGIFSIFSRSIGSVAAYIALTLIIALAVGFLFDTSIQSLLGVLAFWRRPFPGRGGEPKAMVFETIGGALGHKRPSGPATLPSTTVSANPDWNFPALDLLELSSSKPNAGNVARNVEIIAKTLKDFGITVAMGDVNIGPTVAQYTLKPDEGVRLNQITARVNDLSLSLAAHPLRIEAPIPGKAAVGIEVPNKTVATVTLREVLESKEFKQPSGKLTLGIGRDVAGTPFIADLDKMPHLLIAGATGSGKSVAINAIIVTLLYQHSPSTLRFILVDPKRVELIHYNGIPHLLAPVITEVDKTVSALRWAVSEMDRRFETFSQAAKRNIEEFNAHSNEKMPYIVIIIDELADLMAQAANDVEAAVVRLAQMARATGIHLILATQRPSVDVITGLIKANITTRIAFAVASQVDSRTVLDLSGADKLLGHGDMLFVSSEYGKPKRIQGVLIGDKEISRITDFLREQGSANYDESITSYRPSSQRVSGDALIDDDLFDEAKQLVIQAGKASASLLQRRLRIGYARAARLLDLLEQEGAIGPADGQRPRDILVGGAGQFDGPHPSANPDEPKE